MVTVSPLQDTPDAFYYYVHGISADLKEEGDIHHKDELQYRPRPTTASPPSSARSLLAALVAVSAVVFIAYACSFSVGKRLTAVSFGRELADRRGGEECDVSRASQRKRSSADASSEGQQAMIAHIEALQAQSGNVVPTSSAGATTAAPEKVISGTGSAQLETRSQGRFKRRGEYYADLDMEAKHLRLETVVEETPLQPPPPPLDPGLDSLIDSVLFGIDDPFSEDVWLDDEQQLHSTADSSFLSIPSRSGSESASPVVEYTQEPSPTRLDPSLDPLIDSAFSGADDPSSEDSSLTDELMLQSQADASTESEPSVLGSGSESPLVDSTKRGLDSPIDSALSGAEDPSSGDFWLADETQKHPTADSSIGSKSSILGSGSESPVGESTEEPPPPPLDPGLDSLIDSVLSGAADPLSEDIWLDEETLLQPTADSSFGTSPSRSGSESESPVVESTPMPRHLDPALDSLIDSVLSRAEYPSSEDVSLSDEPLLRLTADSSSGSMPSISGGESDSPSVDSTQQPTPPHVDTGIDSPIESALPEADEPLSKDVLVADEPQQRPSADDSIGLQPAVLGGASETPMVPIPQRSPPAPDPNVDPHVDSVLSRVEYSTSEDVWIPDAEPLHPTAGSSSISMPLAWGGDPELSDGNPIAGKIEYVLPSMTPTLPGAPKRVIVRRNLGEPSPADMSGHQMQRRPPVGAESAYSGPSPDAAEVTMGPPQALTPRPLSFPNERMATSSKEPVDESLPSSSGDSPGSWQLPLRVTLFQYSGSVVQSAPVEELPTDATVISHFRWLGDLFPGIPPEVLRTHPFYRHPQRQPPPTRRSFTEKMVLFYAKFQKLPNPALTECREIMKKSSLTLEDFEELVSQAERLCGYAIESMPVAGRRPHPLCVLEALGTIFLVLDTLYCAAEVLGENSGKQWWWPWIVGRLEHARFEQTHECSLSIKSKRNSEVAHALSMALEYYRRGIRPPMIMVIGLKEALFCEERISKFKAILWRAWKEDAEKWRESIKPDVAGSK